MKLKQIFENFLEVVFPSDFKCIFCSKELPTTLPTRTCQECEKKLPYIEGKVCLICGEPIKALSNYCLICKEKVRYFTIARAPFEYSGQIANVIHKFKYENAKYLFKPMASFMAKTYLENNFQPDLILAVPLYRSREKIRGYNQAKLLAQELSKIVNCPFYEDVLIKQKNTQAQADLTFGERQENLVGAFKVFKKDLIKDKTILLIDDVLTTGTTANLCSKELIESGASKVFVLTLARTLSKKDL